VAQFMVVLDSSIVNVALPAMKSGLGLSASDQQWVVNGYLVSFGGLLLFAARAGDLFGRRRVFHAGLLVFSLASLAGGLAQDGWMLLAARLVQGAGAAALAPSSLSLITAGHTEPARRARAMTWWGVAASSAGAAGIVAGGLLASVSWRWVMLVNVPIGAGLLIAGLVCLAPTPNGQRRSRVDLPGAVTVTLSAAALVHGVSAAPEAGWGAARVVVSLVAGVLLLAAFVAVERRSGDPLIPPGILAVANVRMGNVLTLAMGAVITAPLFFLSLYLQQVLGQSAVRTGLSLLPMVAVVSAGVLLSQKLIPIVGARRLVVIGGVVAAAGLAWLGRLPVHSGYAAHVLLPTVVAGAGTGLTMMPAVAASTGGIDPRDAGAASGLLNMCRQLGAALGLAVMVTLATTVTGHSGSGGDAAVVDGYRAAFSALAALALVTAALALRLEPAQDTAAAPAGPHRHPTEPGPARAGRRRA
jgi:EmrB/QacA subfamily drug resistance transporter